MTNRETIQKIASGLRKMTKIPDFLLKCDNNQFHVCWVCGIQIIESAFILNNMTDENVGFVPCWRAGELGHNDILLEVSKFIKGYMEV